MGLTFPQTNLIEFLENVFQNSSNTSQIVGGRSNVPIQQLQLQNLNTPNPGSAVIGGGDAQPEPGSMVLGGKEAQEQLAQRSLLEQEARFAFPAIPPAVLAPAGAAGLGLALGLGLGYYGTQYLNEQSRKNLPQNFQKGLQELLGPTNRYGRPNEELGVPGYWEISWDWQPTAAQHPAPGSGTFAGTSNEDPDFQCRYSPNESAHKNVGLWSSQGRAIAPDFNACEYVFSDGGLPAQPFVTSKRFIPNVPDLPPHPQFPPEYQPINSDGLGQEFQQFPDLFKGLPEFQPLQSKPPQTIPEKQLQPTAPIEPKPQKAVPLEFPTIQFPLKTGQIPDPFNPGNLEDLGEFFKKQIKKQETSTGKITTTYSGVPVVTPAKPAVQQQTNVPDLDTIKKGLTQLQQTLTPEKMKQTTKEGICESLADEDGCLGGAIQELKDFIEQNSGSENCCDELNAKLDELLKRDFSPTLAVPESWEVKVGSDRPQLIIVFADILPNGKVGRRRYPTSIPHYRYAGNSSFKPDIGSYKHGSIWGRLILKDNSRLTVNASDKNEAIRMINVLSQYVDPSLIEPGSKPTIGEYAKDRLRINLIAYQGHYYSKGQKQGKPDWIIQLNEEVV